ncbi:MAG: hypothetical protein Q7S66_04290 [bacterium]|nr:hypothetical protein [bacterium]
MKKPFFLFTIISLFIVSFLFVSVAMADPPPPGTELLAPAAQTLNPLNFTGPADLIARVIIYLVAVIGSFALALYVWAGFVYMTAQGNAERLESSKRILVWTTLGVVAILSSGLVVNLLFQFLK